MNGSKSDDTLFLRNAPRLQEFLELLDYWLTVLFCSAACCGHCFFRNQIGADNQGNGRGHERMIDLHGLHVSEAIHVLKHELSVLRGTARA